MSLRLQILRLLLTEAEIRAMNTCVDTAIIEADRLYEEGRHSDAWAVRGDSRLLDEITGTEDMLDGRL